MVVQSIDRPDVGGVPPKMLAISDQAKAAVNGLLPWMTWEVDDNIMSNICLRATVEDKANWPMNIMHNARYVIVSITPMDGKRYYDPADASVTLSLTSKGSKVKTKLRKYTGPVDKVVAKLKAYLEAIKAE